MPYQRHDKNRYFYLSRAGSNELPGGKIFPRPWSDIGANHQRRRPRGAAKGCRSKVRNFRESQRPDRQLPRGPELHFLRKRSVRSSRTGRRGTKRCTAKCTGSPNRKALAFPRCTLHWAASKAPYLCSRVCIDWDFRFICLDPAKKESDCAVNKVDSSANEYVKSEAVFAVSENVNKSIILWQIVGFCVLASVCFLLFVIRTLKSKCKSLKINVGSLKSRVEFLERKFVKERQVR